MGAKWIPTPAILERVSELSQKGVSQDSIARIVGCHPSTFSAKRKEFPDLDDVIRKAHSSGEEEVVGLLWNIIRDPAHKSHFPALLFYLKTKHRWRETDAQDEKPGLPTGVPFKLKGEGDEPGTDDI